MPVDNINRITWPLRSRHERVGYIPAHSEFSRATVCAASARHFLHNRPLFPKISKEVSFTTRQREWNRSIVSFEYQWRLYRRLSCGRRCPVGLGFFFKILAREPVYCRSVVYPLPFKSQLPGYRFEGTVPGVSHAEKEFWKILFGRGAGMRMVTMEPERIFREARRTKKRISFAIVKRREALPRTIFRRVHIPFSPEKENNWLWPEYINRHGGSVPPVKRAWAKFRLPAAETRSRTIIPHRSHCNGYRSHARGLQIVNVTKNRHPLRDNTRPIVK